MNTSKTNQSALSSTDSEPCLITKRDFSKLASVSLRTTDNWLREKKIPFCKFGKIVRIPWPEAREYLLKNYQINAKTE